MHPAEAMHIADIIYLDGNNNILNYTSTVDIANGVRAIAFCDGEYNVFESGGDEAQTLYCNLGVWEPTVYTACTRKINSN